MLSKKLLFAGSRRAFSTVQVDQLSKIAVVGAGQLGSGIGLVAATKLPDTHVRIIDINETQLANAQNTITKWAQREVRTKKMDQNQMEEFLSRVSYGTTMNDLDDTDLMIEAVSEKFELKKRIFEDAADQMPEDSILASNTSSICISKLADCVPERAGNVIGMHFGNPQPLMKQIVVINGKYTSQATTQFVEDLSKKLDKVTTPAGDAPGFIANRILTPFINEAIIALSEGLGTVEQIDRTMKLGTNAPMGPLAQADFIGLDTILNVMEILHEELGDKYAPSPLLQEYVASGNLGRKSGKGFYTYKR